MFRCNRRRGRRRLIKLFFCLSGLCPPSRSRLAFICAGSQRYRCITIALAILFSHHGLPHFLDDRVGAIQEKVSASSLPASPFQCFKGRDNGRIDSLFKATTQDVFDIDRFDRQTIDSVVNLGDFGTATRLVDSDFFYRF